MPKLRKPPSKNAAAVELGKRGGRKGGLARAARLSPEERSRASALASRARWGLKKPAGASVAELEGTDLRELQKRAYTAALALAQEQGFRLDDDTAMLKLVEAVGGLAKALALKGTKGQPPSRVKSMVAGELAAVLKAVLVAGKALGLDLGERLRSEQEP